jgi:hypothetical protein
MPHLVSGTQVPTTRLVIDTPMATTGSPSGTRVPTNTPVAK